MASQPVKPRPTDEEALFLIYMRRQRARDVLNEILHGFTTFDLKIPTAYQILDYLTNTIQYLEMMLKLLSNNWNNHDVASMYLTITGQAHPNPALMASLKAATMDQKYLMSPAVGIIDHIPELESLGDSLFVLLAAKYRTFMLEKDVDLPESLAQYLLENIERFYRQEFVRIPPGTDMSAAMKAQTAAFQKDVDRIHDNLAQFLSNGNKLRYYQGMGRALVTW